MNRTAIDILVTFTALLLTPPAVLHGAIRLPAVISDHAIIQAGKPVAFWGWATPGDVVSVSFASTRGQTDRTTAKTAADGRWNC